MTGPEGHSSPYPDVPAALRAETEAVSVLGNELLDAASGLTVEEFTARLDELIARSRALWSRAGWTEHEQQVSALAMRTSLQLLAQTLSEDRGDRRRGPTDRSDP